LPIVVEHLLAPLRPDLAVPRQDAQPTAR